MNNKIYFDSHLKAKQLAYERYDYINVLKNILRNSKEVYWFNCDKCIHSFRRSIFKIGRNKWCPFCDSLQLCQDRNCNDCYDKSFANHPNSKYWDYQKNALTPRFVLQNSNDLYWFKCNKCNCSFESQLLSMSHKC